MLSFEQQHRAAQLIDDLQEILEEMRLAALEVNHERYLQARDRWKAVGGDFNALVPDQI